MDLKCTKEFEELRVLVLYLRTFGFFFFGIAGENQRAHLSGKDFLGSAALSVVGLETFSVHSIDRPYPHIIAKFELSISTASQSSDATDLFLSNCAPIPKQLEFAILETLPLKPRVCSELGWIPISSCKAPSIPAPLRTHQSNPSTNAQQCHPHGSRCSCPSIVTSLQ